MQIRTMFLGIILALLVSPTLAQTEKNNDQENSQNPTQWITKSLKEMQKIKVGMTRADLLKVFAMEGGLSTGLQRTYVYRECPFIKVDVEFEPVGRSARDVKGRVTLIESKEDTIKTISKPYLDWLIMD